MGILPPGIEKRWEDNHVEAEAELLAYEQLREREEEDDRMTHYKMLGAKVR